MATTRSLGRVLAAYRTLRGKSLEELAAESGIGRATIVNYEQGHSDPLRKLRALSEALEVPLSTIVRATETDEGLPSG